MKGEVYKVLTQNKCHTEEIAFKSGPCMIPCPGTLQYGNFEVNFEELNQIT